MNESFGNHFKKSGKTALLRKSFQVSILLVLVTSLTAWFAVPAQASEPALEGLETGLANDSFVAPPPVGVDSQSGDPFPGYTQTSEYMIGKVAVGIVLPESNGKLDSSTENWTTAERDAIRSEIKASLNWWAAREPQAHLEFVFDDGTASPTATRYEPISHPYTDQGLWITEVMEKKGYAFSTSYFDQVRDYNNALRDSHHTDWAFTLFVVDSSADDDGRFAGGSSSLFAYAYINGPFAVLTSTNAGYGLDNLDAVAAHEIGHIFGALDQYAAAAVTCDRQGGYLAAENQNSQYGSCKSNQLSIMRGGTYPFSTGEIDTYARAQVGWRDSDNDGILDPLDTPVTLVDQIMPTAATDGNFTFQYAGKVEQSAVPSPLRTGVLINPLVKVQYRITGSDWKDTTPLDGKFDSLTEDFSFNTGTLPGGNVEIEARVLDGFGEVLLNQTLAEFLRPGSNPIQTEHTLFIPMVVLAL